MRRRQQVALSMSKRERRVLELFAQGYLVRHIADALGVSTKTVEAYRTRLGIRFAASTREELVRNARDQGYLSKEAP